MGIGIFHNLPAACKKVGGLEYNGSDHSSFAFCNACDKLVVQFVEQEILTIFSVNHSLDFITERQRRLDNDGEMSFAKESKLFDTVPDVFSVEALESSDSAKSRYTSFSCISRPFV